MSLAPKIPGPQVVAPQLKKFSVAQPTDFAPANINKRVIAFIIDGVILNVLSAGVAIVVKSPIVVSLVSSLLVPVYMIALPLVIGATLGKKAMGLKIVTKDNDTDVPLGALVLRETLGRLASVLPLMLGYLWCRFNKEGRTFHDMIGGTKVVDYRQLKIDKPRHGS